MFQHWWPAGSPSQTVGVAASRTTRRALAAFAAGATTFASKSLLLSLHRTLLFITEIVVHYVVRRSVALVRSAHGGGAIRRPVGAPCGAAFGTGSIRNVPASLLKVKGRIVAAIRPFVCGHRRSHEIIASAKTAEFGLSRAPNGRPISAHPVDRDASRKPDRIQGSERTGRRRQRPFVRGRHRPEPGRKPPTALARGCVPGAVGTRPPINSIPRIRPVDS